VAWSLGVSLINKVSHISTYVGLPKLVRWTTPFLLRNIVVPIYITNCFPVQVVMFGGCMYDGANFVPSKVMYVLDLSQRTPTWRQAHIQQPRASPLISQGGDSVIMLPEYGLVALKQDKVPWFSLCHCRVVPLVAIV
jgi:hypothetical protein